METAEYPEIRDLSPKTFALFAQFITSELGIKMPESKLTMVQSRLLRRVRDLGLNSFEGYAEYFFTASNIEERQQFINAITTNKTDFFREPEHFDFLVRTALPALGQNGAGRRRSPVKIWSAGCSTGAEAYTLAMVLSEYAVQQPDFDFAILGTDISTKVLDQARSGIYPESQILPVAPDIRTKYFVRSRDKSKPLVRVVPQQRRKVTFHHLNFMDEDYGVRDTFDVVFFRNVLIYFDRDTQEAVINKICRHLAPGGYFFAGHSESLANLDTPLRSVQTSIFRKAL